MGLGLFRLEKGKRSGDFIAVLHYRKGNNAEDQDMLFSEQDSERMIENSHKPQHRGKGKIIWNEGCSDGTGDQRGHGVSIHGDFQNATGWGPEQPSLALKLASL